MEGDAAAVVLECDLAVCASRLLIRTDGYFHARQRLIVCFDLGAVIFVSVNRQRTRLRIRSVNGRIGAQINKIVVNLSIHEGFIILRNENCFPLSFAP